MSPFESMKKKNISDTYFAISSKRQAKGYSLPFSGVIFFASFMVRLVAKSFKYRRK